MRFLLRDALLLPEASAALEKQVTEIKKPIPYEDTKMKTFKIMGVTLAFLSLTALPALALDHAPRENVRQPAERMQPCVSHGQDDPTAQLPSKEGHPRREADQVPHRDSASDRQRL